MFLCTLVCQTGVCVCEISEEFPTIYHTESEPYGIFPSPLIYIFGHVGFECLKLPEQKITIIILGYIYYLYVCKD